MNCQRWISGEHLSTAYLYITAAMARLFDVGFTAGHYTSKVAIEYNIQSFLFTQGQKNSFLIEEFKDKMKVIERSEYCEYVFNRGVDCTGLCNFFVPGMGSAEAIAKIQPIFERLKRPGVTMIPSSYYQLDAHAGPFGMCSKNLLCHSTALLTTHCV